MKEPHTKRVFRCHVCGVLGGEWHKPDANGVCWAVRLFPEPDGSYVCGHCKDETNR